MQVSERNRHLSHVPAFRAATTGTSDASEQQGEANHGGDRGLHRPCRERVDAFPEATDDSQGSPDEFYLREQHPDRLHHSGAIAEDGVLPAGLLEGQSRHVHGDLVLAPWNRQGARPHGWRDPPALRGQQGDRRHRRRPRSSLIEDRETNNSLERDPGILLRALHRRARHASAAAKRGDPGGVPEPQHAPAEPRFAARRLKIFPFR